MTATSGMKGPIVGNEISYDDQRLDLADSVQFIKDETLAGRALASGAPVAKDTLDHDHAPGTTHDAAPTASWTPPRPGG
jgi:hypothetical protein